MIEFNPSKILRPLLRGLVIAFFAFIALFLGIAGAAAAERPATVAGTNVLTSQPPSNHRSAFSTNEVAATNLSTSITTNFVQPELDDKYKLAIGDHLSFRILEDGDDPRSLVVTDSGDLEMPYIGRIPAENKTCRQLAGEIKKALEKDYYYQATVVIAVDLMTKSSHGRVYVEGSVRSPGPVDIPGDEVLTLSKAILRAGSFTDFADQRHVKVSRKQDAAPGASAKDDEKVFVVDVGKIFDKGETDSDMALKPGDLIIVKDRLIRGF